MNIAFTVIMTFRSPTSQCFNRCTFHRRHEVIKFYLPKGKPCYLWPCPPSDTSSGVPTSGGREDNTLACPSAERKMKKSSSAGNLTLGRNPNLVTPSVGFPRGIPPPPPQHTPRRPPGAEATLSVAQPHSTASSLRLREQLRAPPRRKSRSSDTHGPHSPSSSTARRQTRCFASRRATPHLPLPPRHTPPPPPPPPPGRADARGVSRATEGRGTVWPLSVARGRRRPLRRLRRRGSVLRSRSPSAASAAPWGGRWGEFRQVSRVWEAPWCEECGQGRSCRC